MIPDEWRKAIDPVFWAREEVGFEPDPWQIEALRADERELIFNCCRQSGKSTTAAVKAVHFAVTRPGSMIILISPSQRQSSELFKKVRNVIRKMRIQPKLLEDNVTSLQLENLSRIISLPSSEDTIVGYSAVDILIVDESSRVPDEITSATLPMLAVTDGQYIQLSTPKGKRGHFWKDWIEGKARKFMITADQVPRISRAFLEKMKTFLGSRKYAQEFMCEFLEDQEGTMFRREWFAGNIVDAYPGQGSRRARFWDRAATKPTKENADPDYTAGCGMVVNDGVFYLHDMRRDRLTSKGNKDLVAYTAQRDGYETAVRMEQEPGSSGKDVIDDYRRSVLVGYNFDGVLSTGSKPSRAEAFAAACEAGNVKIVRGAWDLDGFIDRLCAFPDEDVHDDEVDAAAGAFNFLARFNSTLEPSVDEALVSSLFDEYMGSAGAR